MRTFLPMITLAVYLLLFVSCNKSKDCEGPLSIAKVAPNANPPGYEVLITGTGFTNTTKVLFGNVAAAGLRLEEGLGLVAKVPTGLSGVVDLKVADGSCSVSVDFEVLGGFGNSPVPPPFIVIPQPPATFPPSINNLWFNAFDDDHSLDLFDDDENGTIDPDPVNPEFGAREEHLTIPLLGKDKPNPISGTYNLNPPPNTITLTIDRTANGGAKETFDGQYIDPKPFDPNAFNGILLVSRTTGRQLVLINF